MINVHNTGGCIIHHFFSICKYIFQILNSLGRYISTFRNPKISQETQAKPIYFVLII